MADTLIKTEAEKTAARDKARADAKTNADAAATAHGESHKLSVTAHEERVKADAETDPAKKAAAIKAAGDSAKLADDANAKAAEADRKARGSYEATSVADAKTLAMLPADMPAGHNRAQKFGNDPANPAHDDTLDPTECTVRMSHKGPDHHHLIYCDVHPGMVGDYERAGWNRDDLDEMGVRRSRQKKADETAMPGA